MRGAQPFRGFLVWDVCCQERRGLPLFLAPWPSVQDWNAEHSQPICPRRDQPCQTDRESSGAMPRAPDHRATALYSVGSMTPNHDAVMRIGGEAPKRRTHSSLRHESQGTTSGSATSNRHKRTDRAESAGSLQRPPISVRDAERRRQAQFPPARTATGRPGACAPRRQSWSCACCERSRCGLETTVPRRCPSGR
jgi:hypothetical protein